MSMLATGGVHSQFKGAWLRARVLDQLALTDSDEARPAEAVGSKLVWSRDVGVAVGFLVGTGGLLTAEYVAARNERGYRLQEFDYGAPVGAPGNAKPQFRGSAENLARVREVFKPTVTELASLLGVSRQAIYNWQAGQPIAEQNGARLEQLARAADLLEAEGLAGKPSVLRRKLPGGRTLFEAVRAGEPADAAAAALIDLVNRELAQRQALSSRLAQRARKTIDVGDIGSPRLDEQG